MTGTYRFGSPDEFARALAQLPAPDHRAAGEAAARQAELTKPAGSLGRLETLAVWLAGWQGRARPQLDNAHCLVFAGNHGVTARGISAFPAAVTAQMVANFEAGGAAINQLSAAAGAKLHVQALDLERPTGDIVDGPAMASADCLAALNAGAQAVPADADIILLGEMGIGNTTAAAALALALYGGEASDWVGPGTGLDADGVARKAAVVTQAVDRHLGHIASAFDLMCCLGGRELAAIAGAVLAARRYHIPVLLDGFICSAAAAVLTRDAADSLDHCQAAHLSVEPGHRKLLERLGLEALLSLDMRLGEASGAAVALMLLRAAVAAHNGMATFTEAGVSEKS